MAEGSIDPAERARTVSVAKCADYDRENVASAVAAVLAPLGGIGRFVSPGETILIKPNMLSAREPDKAVTTHPEVLRAVIRLVKGAGAVPIVGDSPSGPSTEGILRNLAAKTGIGRVCEEEGVEFAFFTESKRVENPDGVVAKYFEVTTVLDRVDGVISLAKFKTHTFTVMTGAVKNLFGLMVGLKKAEFHFRLRDRDAFSEMLVDFAERIGPRLTVMDAVVGMEGDGPGGGNPRRIGLLIASTDVHSLDLYVTRMMGIAPTAAPSVAAAQRRGLVALSASQLELVGDAAGTPPIQGFRMPSTVQRYGGIPSVLGAFIGEVVTRKPVFLASECTRCNACVEICPVKALELGPRKPGVDRAACIRCYCCQETCPEKAVVLRRRPLRSLGDGIAGGIKGRKASAPLSERE
ncbi:MAG: DUF362 domain-containing protein [Thermoplasmata archaeon]|jgi:uncharacterized protein (DUF362 family)/NAD-dependent dihydropyrimidine dehydrogenase PreA subunit|nr:DUF362 domain-containing protein [Thermoplasmata archaeon]